MKAKKGEKILIKRTPKASESKTAEPKRDQEKTNWVNRLLQEAWLRKNETEGGPARSGD